MTPLSFTRQPQTDDLGFQRMTSSSRDEALPAAEARPSPRRALVLVNSHSRRGTLALDAPLSVLERAGLALVVERDLDPADLSPRIRAAAGAVDEVIIAGGDGTLNAAADGLVAAGLPLGVLPSGTANDLARTLGLPQDIGAAARVIAAGKLRAIDVGDVNGRLFFNVASIGLSTALTQHLTPTFKQRFGRFSYALAALHALLRVRPFHATLIIGDEKIMVRTLQIAVGNGRYYGGGLAVDRDAAIDDGHLNLYSLEFSRVWRMMLMLRWFRSGEHGAFREVRTARAESFEVVTRRPRPINTDGEITTATPARFTQRRKALRVYAP